MFMVAKPRRPARAVGAPFWAACAPPRPFSAVGTRISCELAEEAQVVLEEEADVVDPVLEHGHALDAHAERPPGDVFGIVAHVAQDLRMHHARTQDLQPARLLAYPTARARAGEAEDIDLGRRLGEW